jgi:hypothetical protein
MIRAEALLPPEALLAAQLSQHPEVRGDFCRQFRFHPQRRWRADFALPKDRPRVLVEVDGGVFARAGATRCWVCGQVPAGRHTSGAGYERDCEKQAEAALLGYVYLRVTPRQVSSGQALSWVLRALRGAG